MTDFSKFFGERIIIFFKQVFLCCGLFKGGAGFASRPCRYVSFERLGQFSRAHRIRGREKIYHGADTDLRCQ